MESALRGSIPTGVKIIETFRFDRAGGFGRLPLHFGRMAETARVLGYPFHEDHARAALAGVVTQPLACPIGGASAPALRCRLTLDAHGKFDLTVAEAGEKPQLWKIAVSEQRLCAANAWLRHKTTQRDTYDQARAALPSGIDEWIFCNERGEVCEGTITSIFLKTGGQMLTPPLSSGLLPGVLRRALIGAGQCREQLLFVADLRAADEIYVGNSLRGLIRAELVGLAT
ncbi:aminotransferase class IV family protein [Cochlodiniinecator piscidefendens]|uniref:aminotransferase class IV family protein n=1 Tax=Cochlodiniinecator piscidefendens TaxID=2715756 RepID=UPI00140DA82E|nr:aminotransferase class IV family protein [Cochlodiniinecator piscidefendens]